jgi:hypothetical protein
MLQRDVSASTPKQTTRVPSNRTNTYNRIGVCASAALSAVALQQNHCPAAMSEYTFCFLLQFFSVSILRQRHASAASTVNNNAYVLLISASGCDGRKYRRSFRDHLAAAFGASACYPVIAPSSSANMANNINLKSCTQQRHPETCL